MIGLLSHQKYVASIVKAIGERPIFEKAGRFSSEQVFQYVTELSRISLQTLVVDVHIADEAVVVKALNWYRVQKPNVRIVIVAVNVPIGASVLGKLVALGIYDIVAVELLDDDDVNAIVPVIQQRLQRPASFAEAHRFMTEVRPVEELTARSSGDVFRTMGRTDDHRARPVEHVIERVVERPIVIRNKMYMFLSLSPQAGATFVAREFAKMMANRGMKPTISEGPFASNPYWDTTLRMKDIVKDELSFTERFMNLEVGETIREDEFVDLSSMYIATMRKGTEWDDERNREFLHAVSLNSQTMIFDVGYAEIEQLESLLDYAKLYVVVDGDLAKFGNELERVKQLQKLYGKHEVYYVLNKSTKYTFKDEMEIELDQNFVADIPAIKQAYFQMLNHPKHHFISDNFEQLENYFEPLLKGYGAAPDTKKKSLLSKWF